MKRIVRLEGVLGVAQVGNSLRVLTADGDDPAAVRARMNRTLAEAGRNAEAVPTPANLEDVFVAATRDSTRSPASPEQAT